MTDTKRDYGSGEVFKVSRVWHIRYRVNGKRHQESSGSYRKAEANALLAKRLTEAQQNEFVGPSAKRFQFEHGAELLEQEYTLNERRSLRRVKGGLKHLRAFFGGMRLMNVSNALLTKYANQRKEAGVALATIQQELAILKRIYYLALEQGCLPKVPTFPTLNVQNARKGYFEREDLEALLRELPHYMTNLVEFANHTGWRMRSELIGKKDWTTQLFPLQWHQVDFVAGVVRLEVGETKNDEGRTFPFAVLPTLQQCLERQRAYTDQWERTLGRIIPWVFHRRGEQMRDFPYGAWRSACARARLADKVGHDFRRTAVRNLVRAGVPEKTAMQLTGHKTRSVFDRYDIVNEADLRMAVEQLATHQAAEQHKRRNILKMRKRAS